MATAVVVVVVLLENKTLHLTVVQCLAVLVALLAAVVGTQTLGLETVLPQALTQAVAGVVEILTHQQELLALAMAVLAVQAFA
jgi:hypothetical protein